MAIETDLEFNRRREVEERSNAVTSATSELKVLRLNMADRYALRTAALLKDAGTAADPL